MISVENPDDGFHKVRTDCCVRRNRRRAHDHHKPQKEEKGLLVLGSVGRPSSVKDVTSYGDCCFGAHLSQRKFARSGSIRYNSFSR